MATPLRSPDGQPSKKRPLWTLVWPVFVLLLVAIAGIAWYFLPQIQLGIAWNRGVSPIEQLGGSVPARWTDAAKNGWLTAEVAAAGIQLDGAPVTDTDLAILQNYVNVYYVSLRNTLITDQAIQHLKAMPSLTTVRLEGTDITMEAREELKVFLSERAKQNNQRQRAAVPAK